MFGLHSDNAGVLTKEVGAVDLVEAEVDDQRVRGILLGDACTALSACMHRVL